jgi:hypothetical protein
MANVEREPSLYCGTEGKAPSGVQIKASGWGSGGFAPEADEISAIQTLIFRQNYIKFDEIDLPIARSYTDDTHDVLRFIFEMVEGNFLKSCIAVEDF